MVASRGRSRRSWALLLAMLAADAAAAGQANEFLIANASDRYDFTLRFTESPCEVPSHPDYASCEGAGVVEVRRKGQSAPLQVLEPVNLFVSFSGESVPLVNSSPRYDYQGVINVGDFNFDGEEDFALQDGNNGSYGGPSYQVYLYAPAASRFELSQPMTDLITETLGFFEVDTAARQLRTAAKSGCCYHEYVAYKVVDNVPKPVHRLIEDALGGADGEDKMTVTEESLIRGKWRRKSRRVDIEAYYAP